MPRALLTLMLAAPLAVVVLLRTVGVGAVFAVYQVGICLLLPAVVCVGVRRWSWRRHLRHLGLTGPGSRRGLGLGALLAAAVVPAVLAFFAVWGGRLLAAADLAAALEDWGLPPGGLGALPVFMILVSGPAEELFWRGFCAAELATVRSRALRLGVPSLLYASYHATTVPALMPHPVLAGAALAAVALAGLGWAWLRERSGSVWPALLSHAAAAGAYMAVARRLLDP